MDPRTKCVKCMIGRRHQCIRWIKLPQSTSTLHLKAYRFHLVILSAYSRVCSKARASGFKSFSCRVFSLFLLFSLSSSFFFSKLLNTVLTRSAPARRNRSSVSLTEPQRPEQHFGQSDRACLFPASGPETPWLHFSNDSNGSPPVR